MWQAGNATLWNCCACPQATMPGVQSQDSETRGVSAADQKPLMTFGNNYYRVWFKLY